MVSVIGSTNWQAVEALGVVGAAAVALMLALMPAFRVHLRRPKLRLLVSDIEPHCVAIASADHIADQVMLRVEVKNVGKTSARNVTVKVTDIWVKDLPVAEDEFDPLGIRPHTSERWRLRQSEPTPLLWASVPSPHVTIAPQAFELAQLVLLNTKSGELELRMEYPERSVIKPKFDQRFGRHRLRILVFAENCDPTSDVIEFVIDGKNYIGEVALAAAPDDAQDTRLLTSLRDLQREIGTSTDI